MKNKQKRDRLIGIEQADSCDGGRVGRLRWWRIEQKNVENREKAHGHGQQCGNFLGAGLREVKEGIGKINCDGQKLDLGW